jgi:integrase
VPPSRRAMEILRDVERDREDGDAYVFAGQREGRPLSNMALLMMLRRMKRGNVTAHGFRSTFSDWASEVSSFNGELREMPWRTRSRTKPSAPIAAATPWKSGGK